MGEVETLKVFFEVFPTLKVDEELQMLFNDVGVKKITTNSERDYIHVHIFSRHVIQKRHIRAMEFRIKEQLFSTANVNVSIIEQYALSEQYTAEALMTEYRNSIVLELKEKSVLAGNMFQQAEITFQDQVMCLELTDTIVSEGKKEEILHLLEEVYRERFGIPVEIRVEYKEKEESKTREYDEQRVQREIDAIFARNKKAHGEESPQPEESQAGEEQKQGSSETKQKEKSLTLGGKSKESGNGKKGFKKEFKRDFVRPLKQGDDPSLIYGRNFEDEPIRLDQVVTEMGEIPFTERLSALKQEKYEMRKPS